MAVSPAGSKGVRRGGHAASWRCVRMVRHNDLHARFERCSRVVGVTVSTAGWKGVRQIRYNDPHGGLEVCEEGTA